MTAPDDDTAVLPWHAQTADEALAALASSGHGLTGAEAARRLAEHGPNRLTPPKRRGPLARFALQFHNVLIYVLLAAGAITAALAHWVDAGVIFGVVVVNAIIGFVQEGKAERALEAIRGMLSPTATVLRDGHRRVLPAADVVPGDVVVLQSGDKVPADLRLLSMRGLQIQEAMLTGESMPVDKAGSALPVDTQLADRTAIAFSGTLVTHGQGSGVVVATGDATEIGRISALLGEVESLETPLVRQMAAFGRLLTAAIVVVAAATGVFGATLRGYAVGEMFLAAVGLAVAAIPEGLPAIMTITLAIGVQRMAGRRAIIRRLPAVETLGSVSVICSDKTGTLTRNEMTVRSIATSRHRFEVTGTGYAPVGAFELDGSEVAMEHRPLLRLLIHDAFLCSDAVLRESEGQWTVDGDPTEGALVTLALKAGLDTEFETKAWPRVDVIPFDSEHRFMATLNHDHEGHAAILVKGAPERLLEMCDRQRAYEGIEPLDRAYWHRRMEEIGARGERLLAVARREATAEHRELRFDDVGDGMVFLGLFGLLDPPRDEAVAAVARCRTAGIRVKMITGDHARTARTIAGLLGLEHPEACLVGQEIDLLDDAALRARVQEIDVFARTSPEHKLRLVDALQADGSVVAMTGDGVNDAPALRRAAVGVAMGHKGTEVAKEAAEMVLTDDNFASIADAVEEGRTVYDNLKKAILFILPTNGGEAMTIVAAIAFGRALPITAAQILWINMITAVTLALALAFEPAEPRVMRRRPRRPDEPLLSGFLVWRVLFVSSVLVVGVFGVFLWLRVGGAELETARTAAVNTLVLFEVFYLFNVRRSDAPAYTGLANGDARAAWIAVGIVVAFQLAYTYAPFMQFLFESRPLSPAVWVLVVAVSAAIFVLVEIEKMLQQPARALLRRRRRRVHAHDHQG